MAGLRPLIIGAVMVLLFSFCIFTFAVGFISRNNPTSSFVNRSEVIDQMNSINHTIEEIRKIGNNASISLDRAEPAPVAFVFLIFDMAFYIPKTLFSVIKDTTSVITGMAHLDLLGQSSPFFLVFAVINFALIITAVLLIIKAIRSGESER